MVAAKSRITIIQCVKISRTGTFPRIPKAPPLDLRLRQPTSRSIALIAATHSSLVRSTATTTFESGADISSA